MVSLKNIKKSFGEKVVLDGVSYDFPDRGLFVLCGDNMSGKTTLLHIIALLDRSFDGDVIIDFSSTKEMGLARLESMRSKFIDLVIPKNNLIPSLSPLENVLLGLSSTAKLPLFFPSRLTDYKDSMSLSGGEEMLVALSACALRNRPVILLDEPTYSLNPKSKKLVTDALLSLSKTSLVIAASHDSDLQLAGTIVRLENGRLR